MVLTPKKKGQTGLGKSTLVNTLFASHLIDSKGRQHVQDLHKQTTQIESVSHGKYNSFFFCLRNINIPTSLL